jgi:transcriptional regulator
MYTPPKFAVDEDTAWGIVAEAGAGLFVRHGEDGLASVLLPVLVSSDRTLVSAHVAKANSWWRGLSDGAEVLAVFVAASAYVSPTNYPSRLEGVNHVPTWNYVMAEVRGRVTLHHDVDWLHQQTGGVTDHFEASRDPRWSTAETSEEYLAKQYQAIVGISLTVTGITASAKLSQNRVDVDREQVRSALADGSLADQVVADWMAR